MKNKLRNKFKPNINQQQQQQQTKSKEQATTTIKNAPTIKRKNIINNFSHIAQEFMSKQKIFQYHIIIATSARIVLLTIITILVITYYIKAEI